MTLEEKAINYCNEMMCTVCSNIRCGYKEKCTEWETRKRYYLAGAKENGVVWHDLRKDPNDLPEDNCTVLVRLKKPITQFSYFCHPEKKFSCWNTEYGCNVYLHNVIAWCEIPQFKE